mmetsp:Transcript_33449/g.40989  ORF Transcript_33449/g.40989 Transcript_33449/m.40989 type:complete len:525 (-) Transcript_33449:996-2570(-)|eukprot:CAMPEP_0204877286 /NCGR_PEP_ID=MMETSP1348-20121228/48103_1 /ASSEMBLY_ACC=CAM_ASM_000700 /TAXON_ID=215587 /ORGANISM="Aplanochytrium stocchinoi, Strain GSBS06" /LENGTH=524 /DNA_ID=CAMNT_0052034137 /DNA_START=256 /DNA_END=1830 /DNA_ORIENTATION=+
MAEYNELDFDDIIFAVFSDGTASASDRDEPKVKNEVLEVPPFNQIKTHHLELQNHQLKSKINLNTENDGNQLTIAEAEEQQKSGLSSSEWLQRRRDQIARASRKARQKRRDEIQKLTVENKRLKTERMDHLQKIEGLEEKVREIRSQGQAVDVQLENELLWKQLEEHKMFIRGVRRLIDGVPTNTVAMKQVLKQGTNYAVTTVHSLISQSIRDDWKVAELKSEHFRHIKPGANLTVTYKRYEAKLDDNSKSKMHIRIDCAWPNVDVRHVLHEYWRMYVEEEYFMHMFATDYNVKLRPIILSDKSNIAVLGEPALVSGNAEECEKINDDDDHIRTFYYKEDCKSTGDVDRDWVYILTRRQRELARSTLLLPKSKTPSLGNSAPRRVISSLNKNKGVVKKRQQRNKNAQKEVYAYGKTKSWICARSTEGHVPLKNMPDTKRNQTPFVEGAIIWPEEVPKENEDHVVVDVTPCARIAEVIAVSENQGFRVLEGPQSIIDCDGALTPRYSMILDRFYYLVMKAAGLAS